MVEILNCVAELQLYNVSLDIKTRQSVPRNLLVLKVSPTWSPASDFTRKVVTSLSEECPSLIA